MERSTQWRASVEVGLNRDHVVDINILPLLTGRKMLTESYGPRLNTTASAVVEN